MKLHNWYVYLPGLGIPPLIRFDALLVYLNLAWDIKADVLVFHGHQACAVLSLGRFAIRN